LSVTGFEDRFAEAKFFQVRSLEQSSRGIYRSVGLVEGSSYAKTSLIRSAVSIEQRLVTNRQTDTDTGSQLVPALA